MKFKSQVFTQVSGSTGGTTFSHNRGGMYTRARATPVNPNTFFQQLIRSIIADLTSRWGNTLTPAERAAWDTYALNVPLLDRLGEPRNVGGLAMYIRSNVQAIQALGPTARLDAAPVVFDLGAFTQPTFAVTAPQDIATSFTATDDWYTGGGRLFVTSARPQNPSINYFKGPYRLAGNVVQPDASPKVITSPFVYTAGQHAFIQARVRQPDGRVSLPIQVFALVA